MSEDIEPTYTPGELLDQGFVVFKTLPHPMRSWALVGCYMGYFALLENTVAKRLGFVLDVDVMLTFILGRNMGVIEKIRAVRTIVNAAVTPARDKEWLDDLLKRVQKAAEQRNIVAHTPFGASRKSDGIEFYAIEAKGTYRRPEIDWSIDQTNAHIDEMRAIADALESDRATAAFTRARTIMLDREPDHVWLRAFLGLDQPTGTT